MTIRTYRDGFAQPFAAPDSPLFDLHTSRGVNGPGKSSAGEGWSLWVRRSLRRGFKISAWAFELQHLDAMAMLVPRVLPFSHGGDET